MKQLISEFREGSAHAQYEEPVLREHIVVYTTFGKGFVTLEFQFNKVKAFVQNIKLKTVNVALTLELNVQNGKTVTFVDR